MAKIKVVQFAVIPAKDYASEQIILLDDKGRVWRESRVGIADNTFYDKMFLPDEPDNE